MERIIIGFMLPFTLTLSACAVPAPGAHLYGKGNPDYTFHGSLPIFVPLPEAATPNDKAFHPLLIGEMKRLGFKITNQLSQKPLVLSFALNSNSAAMLAPLPGNAAISRLPGLWEEVSLELFRYNQIDVDGLIWSGHIKVKRSEFHENPAGTVTPLLELIGKNYDGPISAQAYNGSQPGAVTETLAQKQQAQMEALERRIGQLENEQEKAGESTFNPVAEAKVSSGVLELKDACDKNTIQACMTLAELYLKGGEISSDPQRLNFTRRRAQDKVERRARIWGSCTIRV